VTNIFLFDYPSRLRAWANLRKSLEKLDIKTQCVETDFFWQVVPLQNHYLHTDFIKDWPNPWQLLSDNTFCYYARSLGMIYTMLLLGNKNIDLVDAKDDNNNEVVLVLVDNAKYVLNYWPGTVLNNSITDFKIIRTHDLTPLYSKIG
jgi:hypothetical protein